MTRNCELAKLTTIELWTRFRDCLAVTAAKIAELAELYVELMERGEDVSGFSNPLMIRLPDVASGKLSPDVLVKYADVPSLLDASMRLALEDVRKLVSGAAIQVLQSDGSIERVPPIKMSEKEIERVFGDGRIRTPDEQRPFIEPPKVPKPKPTWDASVVGIWDLYAHMTEPQRTRLERLAKDAGMTPARFVVDYLERHNALMPLPQRKAPPARKPPHADA